jgi:CheY-like chemotaxis protein
MRDSPVLDGRFLNVSQPTLLLVCSDLFFSTQLRSAAEQAGWQARIELSAGSAAARATAETVSAVVVDLELNGLDIGEFVSALGAAESRPPAIAFGPHVQEQRLRAAAEAGCDRVLSRGQISASLSQILEELNVPDRGDRHV